MKNQYIPAAALAVLTVACAGSQSRRESMRPTEHAEGETRDGVQEAIYDVGGDAQVKVWSDGAYRAEVNGEKRTLVHVGFEIENPAGDTVDLDRSMLAVTDVRTDRGPVAAAPILTDSGPRGASRDLVIETEATFLLPRDVAAQDVDSFTVRWAANAGTTRKAELTTFVEHEEVYYYYDSYGPYGYYYGYPYSWYGRPYWW